MTGREHGQEPERGDWKQHHANEAEKAIERPVVQRAMREYADNMGFEFKGLPLYGLTKIASYVAQVARAQALGFDPDLLLLSDEEADQQALRLARIAAEQGKPVYLINPETEGEVPDG